MSETPSIDERIVIGHLMAAGGIVVVTVALAPFRNELNPTTVALALLLVVLVVATRWGSAPAYVSSFLGVISFNYFFLPPFGTLSIAEPQNWVALGAFLFTALAAGQLSSRAKRRAEEAEAGQREIARLYQELQSAFEKASEAEAVKRSEQLKSALLDAVTHDLRTPLTSIKASVTTLLEETQRGQLSALGDPVLHLDSEGRREMLEVIDEESDRLNHFIEGIVELARIETGNLNLSRRWAAVDDIVSSALNRAAPRTRGHRVEVAIEDDLPLLNIDARALAEVIYSLLDNAAKYSPPGSVIRVRAAKVAEERVEISIEDAGTGIPQHLWERVFDRFYRSESASQASTGVGLGLAIARGIIEAHGGRIRVESGANDRGARFVFTVPVGDD